MGIPPPSSRRTALANVLERLIGVEEDLRQIIRASGHPKKLPAYEAHAFVRLAIQALSKQYTNRRAATR